MKSSAKPTKTTAVKQAPQLQWWHWVVGVLLTFFVAFEVYGPALNGEFLFDDSYLPFLTSQVAEAPLSGWLGVRPALMISYWLNYQSSGLNPYPYHVVERTAARIQCRSGRHHRAALLGWVGEIGWMTGSAVDLCGAIFLLHPVQTESVAYVTSRSETMSVFFFLCAYAVFVYRSTESITMMRAMSSSCCSGSPVRSRSTPVLPAFCCLTDYYFVTPFRIEGIRRN